MTGPECIMELLPLRPAESRCPPGICIERGSRLSPCNNKMERPKGLSILLVQLSSPYPNRSHHQTRAQRKRVAAEKEEQRRECALTYEKSRSKRYKACSDVVPVTGLEPVRCRQRRILSPLRLPFHHTGKVRIQYSILLFKMQEKSCKTG